MDGGFDAFISYRRSDGTTAARRLRRLLQDYRPPRALRARAPRKLRVYLDEIYERATDDFFERTTLPALRASSFLVVIATPDAVDRGPGNVDWMRREVAEFGAGPNPANISVVLAGGEWGLRLPADLTVRHPNIEVVDLRDLGPLSFLIPTRAARRADGLVKLVAPLLGFGTDDMPALRREEERRQQLRFGAFSGFACAVLFAVAVMSFVAFTSRNRAIDALLRSKFAAERVVEAAADSMPSGEIRARLLMTGCDLLDALAAESSSEASSASLVACTEERAASHAGMGEAELGDGLVVDATTRIRSRFAASGQADDGLSLIGILAVALERASAPEAKAERRRAALDELIDGSRSVAAKLPEETSPLRLAADTLGKTAVHAADGHGVDFAVAAADGAAYMRTLLADRTGKCSDRIEVAAAFGLLGRLQGISGNKAAAAVAISKGRTELARGEVLVRDDADRLRLSKVAALLDDAGRQR